jgi:hypothetical protein
VPLSAFFRDDWILVNGGSHTLKVHLLVQVVGTSQLDGFLAFLLCVLLRCRLLECLTVSKTKIPDTNSFSLSNTTSLGF